MWLQTYNVRDEKEQWTPPGHSLCSYWCSHLNIAINKARSTRLKKKRHNHLLNCYPKNVAFKLVQNVACFLWFITIHNFSQLNFISQYFMLGFFFFSHVFASIQFLYVYIFRHIKWPQIFFLVPSHSILEQKTISQQWQQNEWIILDLFALKGDQHVCASKCSQIG